MKKSIIEPITPKPIFDKTTIILFASVAIFLIIVVSYATFITFDHTTETKIIKLKYWSMGSRAVVDNCGHSMSYSMSIIPTYPNLNLSDTYEITRDTYNSGEQITKFNLVNKEKYIEKC
jgi:hypothetical protein